MNLTLLKFKWFTARCIEISITEFQSTKQIIHFSKFIQSVLLKLEDRLFELNLDFRSSQSEDFIIYLSSPEVKSLPTLYLKYTALFIHWKVTRSNKVVPLPPTCNACYISPLLYRVTCYINICYFLLPSFHRSVNSVAIVVQIQLFIKGLEAFLQPKL